MEQERNPNSDISSRFLVCYLTLAVLIFAVSIFFGYSFDESVFSGYAANFYYYNSNPFYFWGMGIYYLGIDIAGYFPSIILNVFGLHNVLVEELGVKIPIDIAIFISGFLIFKILLNFKVDRKIAELGAFIYILSPLLFFYAPFQGNPLDVTLMFLLAFVISVQKGRYYLASIFLGIATANYLYPVFLVPIFLFYVLGRSERLSVFVTSIIYGIVAGTGVGAQYFVYFISKLSFSSGTAISSTGGVASLSGSLFHPPIWNLYYFMNLVHGMILPYYIFQIFFILAMLTPSFYFIIKKRGSRLHMRELLVIIALQGLTFAFFSPISDPQYLLASLPFIILIVFFTKRLSLMYVLYALTAIGLLMVAYVVPYNLNQYYVDVNSSAGAIQLFISSRVLSAFSIIYSVLGIALIIIVFKAISNKEAKSNKVKFVKMVKNTSLASGVFIIIFVIVSFVIIFPGLYHLPQQFAYETNDSKSTIDITSISSIHSANEELVTFQQPGEWNIIPTYVKDNSSVGIYLSVTAHPLGFGVIGSNYIFPFNSSHFLGETFYLPVQSQLRFTVGFINDSYKFAKVYLVKEADLNPRNVLDSLSNITNASYYNTFPDHEAQYITSFQVNNTLPAGLYSVIVSGISNRTYYIGGWNGDPSMDNIRNIFTIGNGTQIDNGQQLNNMRFSLFIEAYPIGSINVTLNGRPLIFHVYGFNGLNVKLPSTLIKENNTMKISSNVLSYFHTPEIYYYIPFPNETQLLFINYWNLLIGASLFISLAILFGYSIPTLLGIKLRKG